MDWKRLNHNQTGDILEQIASVSDPNLFSKMHSEASFKPLAFYQDFMLYRIVNYATLPSFSLEFLSNGESFHLLDGSPHPINIANNIGGLYLIESNVIDYADFYLANIRAEDGDIYMIRDVDDLPFIDSLSPDQQATLKDKHVQPEVMIDKDTGNFIILADLFYGGTLLNSAIIVTSNGEIEFKPRSMIMSASQSFGGS